MTYRTRDGGFSIVTDPARFDLGVIHGFLRASYWAPDVHLETVRRSIAHSLGFALFHDDRQVGFARVITDRATFAYLADVFVLEPYRGRGLADWLVASVLEHPEIEGVRYWLLATRDAHGLYARHGFVPLPAPERWMRFPAEPDHAAGRRVAERRAAERAAGDDAPDAPKHS